MKLSVFEKCFLVLPVLPGEGKTPTCTPCIREGRVGEGCHLYIVNELNVLHVVKRGDRVSVPADPPAVPTLSQLVQGCTTIMGNTRLEQLSESFVLTVHEKSAH